MLGPALASLAAVFFRRTVGCVDPRPSGQLWQIMKASDRRYPERAYNSHDSRFRSALAIQQTEDVSAPEEQIASCLMGVSVSSIGRCLVFSQPVAAHLKG
jgi:hypothetical protein